MQPQYLLVIPMSATATARAKLAAMPMQVMAAGLTLPAVMLARGLVGLGEGVALPAMNNLVANNVPPARRSTALGGCFSGFHTGTFADSFQLMTQQVKILHKLTSTLERSQVSELMQTCRRDLH